MSDIRNEMELVHQSILAQCRVGSKESAAVRPRGDEILLAASITPGQAVVVHKRRYGNQPGTRTVILTIDTSTEMAAGNQPHYYQLLFDQFAPAPVPPASQVLNGTPVLDRFARRTGGVVPPPSVITTTVPAGREMPYVPPAPSFRLHDASYNEIARGTDEVWARRLAASMVEFDVALVCFYDGHTQTIQENSYTRRMATLMSEIEVAS